jgi:hypothetical protein
MLSDFPKVECPFIRVLNSKDQYLVIDKVNPGFEWVFDDPDTFAVEKLDGTNVKLKTEHGRLVALQNRMNVIDPLQIIKGKAFIIEGIFLSIQKGYVLTEGEQAGEVIGPKLQGNPYQLQNHLWYPFEKAIAHLRYKSFENHDRTFENWSSWFKDHLKSLFHSKLVGYENASMAEGVIFYNLKRKAEGKSHLAKLRRDMFEWYYDDPNNVARHGGYQKRVTENLTT